MIAGGEDVSSREVVLFQGKYYSHTVDGVSVKVRGF